MVETLMIRPATAADEAAWVRLNRAFMQEVADANPAWGTLKVPCAEAMGRTFREALAAPQTIGLFLAEAGGEVLGFANTWTVFSIWSGGRTLTVDDLYVDAGQRGRGVGEAILKHLEALAREGGCRRIQLHAETGNTGAHALYRKLGMQGEPMLFFRKPLE